MVLSQRGVDIIQALYVQHVDLANGDDDQRRKLTWIMAEQFAFEFGPQWGAKSADPGRPQSKDAIAYREGSKLYAVDWQNGSTRGPQVHAGQELVDITGQNFIAVPPAQHLAPPESPVVVPTPAPAVTCAVDLAPVLEAIDRVRMDIVAAVDVIRERQNADTNTIVANQRDGFKQILDAVSVLRGIGSFFRR